VPLGQHVTAEMSMTDAAAAVSAVVRSEVDAAALLMALPAAVRARVVAAASNLAGPGGAAAAAAARARSREELVAALAGARGSACVMDALLAVWWEAVTPVLEGASAEPFSPQVCGCS
jgi:hypothetical protein